VDIVIGTWIEGGGVSRWNNFVFVIVVALTISLVFSDLSN
jgi:hypothetical protein